MVVWLYDSIVCPVSPQSILIFLAVRPGHEQSLGFTPAKHECLDIWLQSRRFRAKGSCLLTETIVIGESLN